MSKHLGSLFERVVRALARGCVPIDGSQCDGPCVVNGPIDATQGARDHDDDQQPPIRWLNLR
jgi:hypothetical protein